jgi:hypothetical protein
MVCLACYKVYFSDVAFTGVVPFSFIVCFSYFVMFLLLLYTWLYCSCQLLVIILFYAICLCQVVGYIQRYDGYRLCM